MRVVAIIFLSFLTVHCGNSEFSGSGSASPSSEVKADKSKDSVSEVSDEDDLENEATLQKSADEKKQDSDSSTSVPEPAVDPIIVPEGTFCGVHFNQGFVSSGLLLEGLDTKELSLKDTMDDIIGMVVLANTKVEFFNSASETIGVVNGPMRIGPVQSYGHWIPYLQVPGEWLNYPTDAGIESVFAGAVRIKVMPLGNPRCVLPQQVQTP